MLLLACLLLAACCPFMVKAFDGHQNLIEMSCLRLQQASRKASGHLTMHFIIIKRMMDDEYEAIWEEVLMWEGKK